MFAAERHLAVALASALFALAPSSAGAQVGEVTGVVYDSISEQPLSDAAVFLWDTPYRAVSGADGRFTIRNVPPGQYSVLFFHTSLGELGVSPGPVPVQVQEGGRHPVSLAIPSRATLVRTQCLMEDRPEGAGAVAGRAIDGQTQVSLQRLAAAMSWPRGHSCRR